MLLNSHIIANSYFRKQFGKRAVACWQQSRLRKITKDRSLVSSINYNVRRRASRLKRKLLRIFGSQLTPIALPLT